MPTVYPQGTCRPLTALSDLGEHKLGRMQPLESWWLVFAIFLLLRDELPSAQDQVCLFIKGIPGTV